jgi:hypothetical protein
MLLPLNRVPLDSTTRFISLHCTSYPSLRKIINQAIEPKIAGLLTIPDFLFVVEHKKPANKTWLINLSNLWQSLIATNQYNISVHSEILCKLMNKNFVIICTKSRIIILSPTETAILQFFPMLFLYEMPYLETISAQLLIVL